MFIKTFVCHKQRYYNSKHARTSEIRRQENGSKRKHVPARKRALSNQELFEYGKKRAAIVGKENVYDFSIGNPSIPAPQIVNDTIKELVTDYDSVALHGYTSAQGDVETRAAIAEF